MPAHCHICGAPMARDLAAAIAHLRDPAHPYGAASRLVAAFLEGASGKEADS